MKNIAGVLFVLSFMFSCINLNKKPDYVIPHNDMVDIIVKIHITDGMLNINKVRRDLAKQDSINYYEAIFKSFGYTRPDFDTSIYFYSNNIAEYDKIYEEVLNKLGEMETQLKEESAQEAKENEELKAKKEAKKRNKATTDDEEW
ncbi:MAG TPA: hypothetical protein DCG75_15135 [Bacteroidales bacterium]|nr:hypothetical protein [Bacteroidales bacterium]